MLFYHAKTTVCEQSLDCKLLQAESTETVTRMGNTSAVKTETRGEEKRTISETKSD
jgi:hypothetical protein